MNTVVKRVCFNILSASFSINYRRIITLVTLFVNIFIRIFSDNFRTVPRLPRNQLFYINISIVKFRNCKNCTKFKKGIDIIDLQC